MYAIQNGNKFVKVQYFLRADEAHDFTITAKPNTYKTRRECEKSLQHLLTLLDFRISINAQHLKEDNERIARYTKDLDRARAKIAELEHLPYREVYMKISKLEATVHRAQEMLDNADAKFLQRSLARYQQIKQTGFSVAEVQQTVNVVDKVDPGERTSRNEERMTGK